MNKKKITSSLELTLIIIIAFLMETNEAKVVKKSRAHRIVVEGQEEKEYNTHPGFGGIPFEQFFDPTQPHQEMTTAFWVPQCVYLFDVTTGSFQEKPIKRDGGVSGYYLKATKDLSLAGERVYKDHQILNPENQFLLETLRKYVTDEDDDNDISHAYIYIFESLKLEALLIFNRKESCKSFIPLTNFEIPKEVPLTENTQISLQKGKVYTEQKLLHTFATIVELIKQYPALEFILEQSKINS